MTDILIHEFLTSAHSCKHFLSRKTILVKENLWAARKSILPDVLKQLTCRQHLHMDCHQRLHIVFRIVWTHTSCLTVRGKSATNLGDWHTLHYYSKLSKTKLVIVSYNRLDHTLVGDSRNMEWTGEKGHNFTKKQNDVEFGDRWHAEFLHPVHFDRHSSEKRRLARLRHTFGYSEIDPSSSMVSRC